MQYKFIDVSRWQGVVDWEKVKGKVDGVIMRAGFGSNTVATDEYIDMKFVRNITECNRLGIPCGVYWFSYALTEADAKKEAELCLKAIEPYRVELPVCFDLEYDTVNNAAKKGVTITKKKATAFAHAFLQTIENAGYYAMLYANPDFLNRYFDETVVRYDLWLAHWFDNPDFAKPPRECGIWQYGVTRIDGINGDVDGDIAYKNYPEMIKACKLNRLHIEKPWYSDAQEWVKANGISDGTRPDEPATRAEVWQFLYNRCMKGD